jgi:hypothetical protein
LGSGEEAMLLVQSPALVVASTITEAKSKGERWCRSKAEAARAVARLDSEAACRVMFAVLSEPTNRARTRPRRDPAACLPCRPVDVPRATLTA